MDDDDFVLNLSFEAPTSTPKRKKAGRGTPRERRDRRVQAQQSPQRKRKAEHEEPEPRTDGAGAAPRSSRPSKRPKLDVEDTSQETPSRAPGHPSQIISSLFSHNPTIPNTDSKSAPARAGKPSNAPLRDSSSFAGLGLHPLLTSHLQTKLGIEKPTSIQRTALSTLIRPYGDDTEKHYPESLSDVFIQSQTGSGKTMSYLLPIIQDLLPLSSLSYIDRSIGTLAVILAPTRELAKQISDVLEQILSMRLHGDDDSSDNDEDTPRFTRWLVSGLLTGGATRTHEKARLRKGLPILVSTPGRLLDHLQNTASFEVSKCRWLVLDEADRLMDLGFDETITAILRALEGRYKLASQAAESGPTVDVGWDWSRPRRTILCSATMREDVQKLAGVALRNPIIIKGLSSDESEQNVPLLLKNESNKFAPPSQLLQKYLVVPLKLRLVALVALLRSLLSHSSSQSPSRRASYKERQRIIVFLSCTDSVDFIWTLLGGASMGGRTDEEDEVDRSLEMRKTDERSDSAAAQGPLSRPTDEIRKYSALLPSTSLFRLHGSLSLQTRLASLKAFTSDSDKRPNSIPSQESAILFCTSVASRGLDLPSVQAVVQYDLPTEGGATEYVHRVGRTARVGRGGEAWAFISPSELDWVQWVENKMSDETEGRPSESRLHSVTLADVLKSGFGSTKPEFEARATQVQLSFERWAIANKERAALARKAFSSHVRAYATHPSDEKHLFHVRNLHLGHLAKSFALREAPSNMGPSPRHNNKAKPGQSTGKQDKLTKGVTDRMRTAIKKQTRMGAVSDFQIADSVLLENSV